MTHLLLALVLAQADPHAGVDMPPATTDLEGIEAMLKGDGLVGSIHGSVPSRGLLVLTYRIPYDFFSHAEFPLVPASDKVAAVMNRLKRHDMIKIKGAFIRSKAPLKHISVVEIVDGRVYAGEPALPPREGVEGRDAGDLFIKNEAIGSVHAVASDGRILVFEYRNAVLPVFVEDPKQTEGLWRGDKIRLRYKVRSHEGRPHLFVTGNKTIVVLDRITARNGKHIVREGSLVRFPKSPQIKLDVYALETVDADGVMRTYTLVNFKDKRVFDAINAKLAAAWAAAASNALDGRNKQVNPKLRVVARGTLNVQDKSQANPQILLEGPDALTVTP